ncbi:MAG: hemolysin D [Bacteroidetes bacterium]|jgi:hemolysin III|nr:MAG: hemolysin D [Bacteroidota bacterium]PTM19687.1 MAG: hemolysin D [Bacteroidota bacterium]
MARFFSKKDTPKQIPQEEIANAVSHGIGLLAALVSTPFVISYVSAKTGPLILAGVSLFLLSAVILYLSSTLYHSLREGRLKEIFQMIDHIAIFLLIAGSYTPFTLGVLNGTFGWIMFGLIWTCAIGGITLKIVTGITHERIYVAFYLFMGWLIVVAIKPLYESIDPMGLVWIVIGGAAYTLGVIFYAMPRRAYTHFVWHLFVLAGTSAHFVAVMLYSY